MFGLREVPYTLTNYSWRRLIDYDGNGGEPMTRWLNLNNSYDKWQWKIFLFDCLISHLMKMNKINTEQNYFLIINLTIIKVWNSLNYFVLRKKWLIPNNSNVMYLYTKNFIFHSELFQIKT